MGGHAAQKIDDLIRGEHGVDAAHPQHRRHTDHGPGAAAEKGLQSHLVADEIHPQHGEAEVVVRPVPLTVDWLGWLCYLPDKWECLR